MYRDIPTELRELIEPVVADYGYELVDVHIQRGGGPGSMKVTIDTPAGDGRVPVEALARVSRELGTQLDAADAMPGAYRLEVSSPGLDRVLGREKDFAAACAAGQEVKITTRGPLAGRRRFRGKLVDFRSRSTADESESGEDSESGKGEAVADGSEAEGTNDATVFLQDGGDSFEIPFSEIDRANAIYEFTSADFREDPKTGR